MKIIRTLILGAAAVALPFTAQEAVITPAAHAAVVREAAGAAPSVDCTVHVKGTATKHKTWTGTVTANRCGRKIKAKLIADQGTVNCTAYGQQATRKAPPQYKLHKLGPTSGNQGGACEFFVPGLYTIHWWGYIWHAVHGGTWHSVKVGSRHRGPLRVNSARRPHPAQVLTGPAGRTGAIISSLVTPQIRCHQGQTCLWQFVGYSGHVVRKSTPVNQWIVIPSGARGSTTNFFTAKNDWLYSLSTRSWQCIGAGTRRPNASSFGRIYFSTRDSCRASTRPSPPSH